MSVMCRLFFYIFINIDKYLKPEKMITEQKKNIDVKPIHNTFLALSKAIKY